MIGEERMLEIVEKLKEVVHWDQTICLPDTIRDIHEAIDLIPLGWQAANNQEDGRVSVALESDDG